MGNFIKVFLQLILGLCNVNPGGNKGVEGGKNSLYLLGINQVKKMINKCRFLLQYFKNLVNILPPSSLPQPRCKALKLDSWLRRAAGQSKYINLAANEEHGYISAMMMNLWARGGWVLNVLCIELPKQPLLISSSQWLNLISGALWESSEDWAGQVFFPGWKSLSSFLDTLTRLPAEWAASCPFPHLLPTKKCVAEPHWNVHLDLTSLIVFYT